MAVILGEPGCDELAVRLENALARLMPAAIRVELGIVIEARLWPAGQDVIDRFLRDAKIDIVPVDADLAARAMSGWRRYGKGRHPAGLNFGDCLGGAEKGPGTGSEAAARRVVVAGDVTVDWHLARVRKLADSGAAWNAADRTEVYVRPGGAALMASLMSEVAATLADDGIDVKVRSPSDPAEPIAPAKPIAPADPRFHHSFAVWSQYPRRRGDRDRRVWRVEEFLGLDRARTTEAVTPAQGADADSPAGADLVILDDADLGFRASPSLWPTVLRLGDDAAAPDTLPQPWILLKMACPVASGELWRRLLRLHARRLVVVMTLNDLRLSDVRIGRELSWERIAGDLAREVVRQPAVNGLVHCAQVVVSLGTGGAVLLSRRETLDGHHDRLDRPDCHVFFDPESIENSWAEQYPGAVIGYTSCLAAGIARELVADPEQPKIRRGVRRGLAAARALHLLGYGASDSRQGRAGLTFPVGAIATELAVANPGSSRWPKLSSRSGTPGQSSRSATRRALRPSPSPSPSRVLRPRSGTFPSGASASS